MLTQASETVDTWQVRVHDLIARGVAEARHKNGWTQEETARVFRLYGLMAWRTSTVGSLEAGLRRPRLDEVMLMARALEVTLDELLPGADEHIDMGDGAVMTPRGLRELLKGGFAQYDNMPADQAPYEYFPIDEERAEVWRRSEAERQRVEPLLEPIRLWCREHGFRLMRGDTVDAFRLPSDAERHAGRRLGVEPAQVKLAARVLWDHRDFSEERDARIGDEDARAAMDKRTLQAQRGLVTREMLRELREFLSNVYGTNPSANGDDAP
jgi:transcriptional regulator with XRE-family HTH domain